MRNLMFAAVFSVLLAAPAMDAFAQAGTSFGAGSLGSNGDPDDQIFASGFEGSEAQTPMLVFVSPSAQNSVVSSAALLVDVLVTPAASPVVAVTINGTEANVGSVAGNGHHYLAEIALQDGQNRIVAEARFANDATIAAEIQVTYVGLAQITVTNPTDWETLGPLPGTSGNATNLTGAVQRAVTVSGTLNRPVERVEVNQQLAQLEASGKAFHFDEFLLREGANLISVNAIDAYGRISTANLTVYVDQTAPLLSVEGLASVTSANRIDVRGVVNDAVEGGLNAAEPRVTILNTANTQTTTAIASDRYYIAQDVPLELGNNTLRVTAVDQVGNARSREASVTRIAAGSPRVTLLGGNRQRARVSTQLPQPLAIAAIAPDGLPLAGIPIHFDVLRGSGHLSDTQGAIPRPDGLNPARHQVVNTDAAGRAQIWLTLGSEALEAGDSVRARSLDHSEEVTFTATGLRGEPFSVLVAGTAGTQYAQTLSQPVDAMGVVVLDRDNNPSISVPVTFRVSSGDAHFTAQSTPNGTPAQDGQSIVVSTDKNGMASVRPMTGEHAGVVEVVASATLGSGGSVGNSVLRLIVLERRDGPTSFSGIALDHSGAPLAGAIVSISRTNLSARSDATGKFRFEDSVPPGKIDVYIDGRDVRAQLGGQQLEYPALHFETAIIQGQANQLPHPIYLPPIDRSREKIVGGDSDVSLTMPELEGFEMIVKANSVTFPDGSRVGPMVVTRVNGDRLPMVPPGGYATFGAVAWTIQPTGARFDPPVEVRIPNVTGMQPGETNEIVQWDHDLATFVPMGRGTVSEDGTQLVTDAGSGITKAGWGGGPPPVTPNDGENECEKDLQRNTPTLTITANGQPTKLFTPLSAVGNANVNFAATATQCSSPRTIAWTVGGNSAASTAMSFSHTYAGVVDDAVSATISCGCGHSATANVRVVVAKVEFKQAARCSGFDEDMTPPWIMVPKSGANTSIATIVPASVATDVEFKSTSSGTATASPATATASPQTVTVSGVAAGTTDIEAKNGISVAFGMLKASVKDRVNKTVEIHAITEQNDDVQDHPVGYFPVDQVCVTRGANRILDTTPHANDVLVSLPVFGDLIHTGADGICDSTAAGDDDQAIPQGQRLGFTVCVSAGSNGFRDTSAASGDDVLGANDINAGPDGICDSTANNVDLVPLDVPTAAALQTYLNDIAWGKQANVHFTVTRSDHTVNYDLDRNTKLADPWEYSRTWVEIDAVSAVARNPNVDYNIYYAKYYEYPVALADFDRRESWFGDLKTASVQLISAHEIGHLLGRGHSVSANMALDLMYEYVDGSSGCRIPKDDWEGVNP